MNNIKKEDEKLRYQDVCAVCLQASPSSKLLRDSPVFSTNFGRASMLRAAFGALAINIFDEEMAKTTQLCKSCDSKLEYFAIFLEQCQNSQRVLNCDVKHETNDEFLLESNPGACVSVEMDEMLQDSSDSEVTLDITRKRIVQRKRKRKKDEPKKVKCEICEKLFKTQERLVVHINLKHPDNAAFQCDLCNQGFSHARAFKQHNEQKHKAQLPYPCRLCSLQFTDKDALVEHSKEKHGVLIEKDEIKEVERSRIYGCDGCGGAFPDLVTMRSHLKECHPDDASTGFHMRYMCQCGRSFNRPYKLEIHQAREHENGRRDGRTTCPECGKVFSSPQVMNYHRNKHLGLLPFLCSSCPKAFSGPDGLSSHEKRKHLGMVFKPAKRRIVLCDNCGKKFTDKKGLERHIIRHHGDGVRAFKCPEEGCIKTFVVAEDIPRHLRIVHGPPRFFCEVCNKGYVTKHALKYHHNYSHENYRPHACDKCSMMFKTKAHLEKHIRTHTGEKPYGCPHCSYKCAEQTNLNKHIKIHTRVNYE